MRFIFPWLYGLCTVSGEPASVPTNFLFDNNDYVTELRKPADLINFIHSLENYSQPYCQRSRIFLLYSGHCPHCHAFQPTWTAFAKGIRCGESNMEVGAFECVGRDHERMNNAKEWASIRNNLLPIIDDDEDDTISPRELCNVLKNEYYPTLVLAIANSCRLRSPIKKLMPFDKNITLYHIPVDSQSTNVHSLNELLLREKLIPKCASSRSTKDMDDKIKKWLATYEATSRDQRPRWETNAAQIAPHFRIHDAALGLFHILDAWILSEKVHPTKEEIKAIKNFLKLARATALDHSLRVQLTHLLEFVRTRSHQLTSTEWQVQLESLSIYGLTLKDVHHDPLKYSLTCSQPSCLVWTFVHVSAHSSLLLQAERQTLESEKTNEADYIDLSMGDDMGEVEHESDVHSLTRHIRPKDYLLTIRNLVYYFFDCMSCRNHFVQAYDNCEADGCRWTVSGIHEESFEGSSAVGLVLHLWRFHNIVTMRTATGHTVDRLRVDFNEDPTGNHTRLSYLETDVRMPTKELCADMNLKCGKHGVVISKGLVEAMMDAGDDDSKLQFDHYKDYDLAIIISFLSKFYIPEEILKDIGNIDTLTWDKDKKQMKIETNRTT